MMFEPMLSDSNRLKFESKIVRLGDCWAWQGDLKKRGYFGWYNSRKWRVAIASRMSYAIYRGPIPDGLQACHRCDNPGCVRPEHLFLGTQQDNLDDAKAKGRIYGGDRHHFRRNPERTRGENNGRARLTAAAVCEIRRRHAAGDRPVVLQREFGLSSGGISSILSRRAWSWLP